MAAVAQRVEEEAEGTAEAEVGVVDAVSAEVPVAVPEPVAAAATPKRNPPRTRCGPSKDCCKGKASPKSYE